MERRREGEKERRREGDTELEKDSETEERTAVNTVPPVRHPLRRTLHLSHGGVHGHLVCPPHLILELDHLTGTLP